MTTPLTPEICFHRRRIERRAGDRAKLAVGDIAGLPLPGSTFSEIGKRAAISYFHLERQASIGRKLAGLLRVSG